MYHVAVGTQVSNRLPAAASAQETLFFSTHDTFLTSRGLRYALTLPVVHEINHLQVRSLRKTKAKYLDTPPGGGLQKRQ